MNSAFVKILLAPLAMLYKIATDVRNLLYDFGVLPSYQAPVPVVCIGNLSAGGTGKTPHVEMLINKLEGKFNIAVLSRGYKRRTSGYLELTLDTLAQDSGDEPLQIFRKNQGKIVSAVCEDRVKGIKNLLANHPEVSLILMDDGYQHRAVCPTVNIVLTDYRLPFWTDFLLPMGRLREGRRHCRRADLLLITKTPDQLKSSQIISAVARASRYFKKRNSIYFSSVSHGAPLPALAGDTMALPGNNVTLITGIANPGLLKDFVSTQYNLISHLILADHHQYTESDLSALLSTKSKPEGHFFLTTEKDLVKWLAPDLRNLLEDKAVFYVPFTCHFTAREADFDIKLITLLSASRV